MVLTIQGSTMEGVVPRPSSSEESHPCDFPSVLLFTLIFRCGFLCHLISDWIILRSYSEHSIHAYQMLSHEHC